MSNQNRLDANNCNKAKCRTCMFGPTPIELDPGRLEEIKQYLITFKSSHVCHTTDKTCYGALELQTQVMYKMGIIKEETVKCFLETAAKHLNQ